VYAHLQWLQNGNDWYNTGVFLVKGEMILILRIHSVFNWMRSLSIQLLHVFGVLSGRYCGALEKDKYLAYQVLQDLFTQI